MLLYVEHFGEQEAYESLVAMSLSTSLLFLDGEEESRHQVLSHIVQPARLGGQTVRVYFVVNATEQTPALADAALDHGDLPAAAGMCREALVQSCCACLVEIVCGEYAEVVAVAVVVVVVRRRHKVTSAVHVRVEELVVVAVKRIRCQAHADRHGLLVARVTVFVALVDRSARDAGEEAQVASADHPQRSARVEAHVLGGEVGARTDAHVVAAARYEASDLVDAALAQRAQVAEVEAAAQAQHALIVVADIVLVVVVQLALLYALAVYAHNFCWCCCCCCWLAAIKARQHLDQLTSAKGAAAVVVVDEKSPHQKSIQIW